MGGVGKTTIAEALFKRLSSQYQGCCFVENVREKWKQHGEYELRNRLLTKILGDQMCIEDRLQRRKVLIVLDDVCDSQQMDYLIGEKNKYGPGSRIIVTTRNKDVLQREDIGQYEVKPLNNKEALQLFCLKAFQQECPKNEFIHLSNMVIDYAGGIPLAITVLGSFLYSKNQEEWKGTLQKLEKFPNPKIHNVLRLSYEELDDQEKEIFLDIACFLKGEEKDKIIDLVDGYNSSIYIGLRNLLDKSLISISKTEHVQMHDLIQAMGQYIVREESMKHPEKRSRLWDSEDIYHVLKCKTGNHQSIESISLNMSEIKEVQISPDMFSRMPSLRLLKLYMPKYPYKCNMIIPKDLQCLPDRLRYLCWDHFPLNTLPSSFRVEMLVEIRLKNSTIKKLWEGDQDVANLKILWLQNCHELLELPCLKKAAKLREIDLTHCRSLLHVPSYILSLDSLLHLILEGCKQLQCIQSDKPSKSIQVLNLVGCSNLVEFSVASKNLNKLYLDETAIEELSFSIGQVSNLSHLSLSGCQRLKKLPPVPNTPRSIRLLILDYCSELSKLPENLGHLSTLEELCLSGSAIETLPTSIKLLLHLTTLDVSDCKRLRSLPELPPLLINLDASGCISLENVPRIALRARMKDCFGGQKMGLLPRQYQGPKTSIHHGFYHIMFRFINCTKLDENACKTILDEAAIRIKYATYVSSMVEASTNPHHQLYLCTDASDPELFYYISRLCFFKYIADRYPESTRIENEHSHAFIANFNGISGGDLKCLTLALEMNKEENTDVDFDTSMQRICMQQGFPIPILRNVSKRWALVFEVMLPGSSVPRWIKYRTTLTPFIITVELPPSSLLLGFAFCFVLEKSWHLAHSSILFKCHLEDAKGNRTSENFCFHYHTIIRGSDFVPLSDVVIMSYGATFFPRILQKAKEIRATDQCLTFNPKLTFQLCWGEMKGQSISQIKEFGVWPIYSSDLESDNPIEPVELVVKPQKRKLKKKRKRDLLLWSCRWQALIMRMKMSNRKRINLSTSSRIKGRRSKILDEQQQQLSPRKKSKRSHHIDELGECSSRIEKQEELQPLHQTKKLNKRKKNA